jgi:hypothetical protein
MKLQFLTACLATSVAAAIAFAMSAEARSKNARHVREVPRDCTPYNGPSGFYSNIWCSGASANSAPWALTTASEPAKYRKKGKRRN